MEDATTGPLDPEFAVRLTSNDWMAKVSFGKWVISDYVGGSMRHQVLGLLGRASASEALHPHEREQVMNLLIGILERL